MVSDTPAVEQVLFGDNGLAQGLRQNTLVIDMGTTAATANRDFAARLADIGVAYVDAPVSGGDVGARAQFLLGELKVTDGDHEAAILEYNRVLTSFFDHSVAASAQYRLGRCFDALDRPHDATSAYQAEGVPLVVLGGREYGTGSSRDWAAKGANLYMLCRSPDKAESARQEIVRQTDNASVRVVSRSEHASTARAAPVFG